MTLELGKKVPDLSLHIGQDNVIKLSDLKEKFVILYFYPKDDTPGCTIEAQDFNKLKPEFDKLNTVIIGVSKDKLDSHDKFKEKYNLGFDLASDANSNLCEQLGVWIEKSMFGKKYMGIDRATFLLDKEGIVKHIWRSVNAKNHAQEVLEKLRTMLS
ncbi:thioredoxin-dependent thiol peroxidase [Rickettsia sp. Tenjiku01]|uniref:thioredoxin-dependent thiol peroxidase n=1 Tax=Rickettsia sp. Tenjiku01 TaxID=1736693 RepID=UPI0007DB60B9|nr:thioredoxin-dependent thiol peroxidase [Rickettsia sp. Tenjiku01]